MNVKELKQKFKITDSPKRSLEMLIEEVLEGRYGTKNRSRLLLFLDYIKNNL